MTIFETSQGFVNIEGYRLNVTARLDPENRQHMKDLVEKTVKLWLFVAKQITTGVRTVTYNTTPEDAIKANHFAPMAEARVTVWADTPSGAGFTVHSHSHAQDALDVYFARMDALSGFAPQNSPQATPTPKTQENAPAPQQNSMAGKNPTLSTDVISATRAPNPKEVLYADGQKVAFLVNKVAMGANKGSATYALWGPLGQKYPLTTIYKCKPNSDENSPNYIAVKDFIVGLGLSVDAGKVEAVGNWVLTVQSAHVPQADGTKKEYLNILSLAPIQMGATA